jgi:hypothetical protein
MPKYVAPNLRGPKLVWVASKGGWMCVGTMALEAWFNWSHIVHHMLSQVMKLSAHPNPMPSENWVKSKCYQHTSAMFTLWLVYWYIWWLANMRVEAWKLKDHELTKVYLLLIISFGCIWVDWIG